MGFRAALNALTASFAEGGAEKLKEFLRQQHHKQLEMERQLKSFQDKEEAEKKEEEQRGEREKERMAEAKRKARERGKEIARLINEGADGSRNDGDGEDEEMSSGTDLETAGWSKVRKRMRKIEDKFYDLESKCEYEHRESKRADHASQLENAKKVLEVTISKRTSEAERLDKVKWLLRVSDQEGFAVETTTSQQTTAVYVLFPSPTSADIAKKTMIRYLKNAGMTGQFFIKETRTQVLREGQDPMTALAALLRRGGAEYKTEVRSASANGPHFLVGIKGEARLLLAASRSLFGNIVEIWSCTEIRSTLHEMIRNLRERRAYKDRRFDELDGEPPRWAKSAYDDDEEERKTKGGGRGGGGGGGGGGGSTGLTGGASNSSNGGKGQRLGTGGGQQHFQQQGQQQHAPWTMQQRPYQQHAHHHHHHQTPHNYYAHGGGVTTTTSMAPAAPTNPATGTTGWLYPRTSSSAASSAAAAAAPPMMPPWQQATQWGWPSF